VILLNENRRRWGTLSELAEERRISTKTARRMITRGEVYAERVGPRLIRVDLDSVDARPLQYASGDAA